MAPARRIDKMKVESLDIVRKGRKLYLDRNYTQCDQIMAKTPNLDVLGVQMSVKFGECRLAFFVAFKAKKAIFMAFRVLSDFC